jgi:hypothetical protein
MREGMTTKRTDPRNSTNPSQPTFHPDPVEITPGRATKGNVTMERTVNGESLAPSNTPTRR